MSIEIRYYDHNVLRTYLLRDAILDGEFEIPLIRTSKLIPNRLIPFSKALKTKDYDQWIMFYEHDREFIRIWNQPRRYLPILKRFRGVIAPDFSTYRAMPLVMQAWSVYRSHVLAHWWHQNGIEVIPTITFADVSSYAFAFSGIEPNSTIAVGTVGALQNTSDRDFFKQGLYTAIDRLSPRHMIVYGSAPHDIFSILDGKNISIHIFPPYPHPFPKRRRY